MNSTAQLKLLVSRINEANSLRELIQEDKLREAMEEMPNILEVLKESVSVNTHRFDQNYVDPVPLSKLPNFNHLLAEAGPEELDSIANTMIFVMEREIFNISKKIVEK